MDVLRHLPGTTDTTTDTNSLTEQKRRPIRSEKNFQTRFQVRGLTTPCY